MQIRSDFLTKNKDKKTSSAPSTGLYFTPTRESQFVYFTLYRQILYSCDSEIFHTDEIYNDSKPVFVIKFSRQNN